jgi:hypothetical protein
MSEIIIYDDGNVELKTTFEDETIWLSQKQMSKLFDKSTKTISEHINNIFKEGELDKNSVIRNFRITAEDGKEYNVIHYNLDVIISVGYRVKSKRGTQFRIWANKILKDYLIKGYALNQERLKQQKIDELDKTIKLIKQSLKNEKLSIKEAKIYDGEL